jgi:hypothetical protein
MLLLGIVNIWYGGSRGWFGTALIASRAEHARVQKCAVRRCKNAHINNSIST